MLLDPVVVTALRTLQALADGGPELREHHQPAARAGFWGRGERQYFYLGRIASWDLASRTGPEFSEQGRGTYQLEQVPLTTAGLGVIDLQPTAIAGLLRDAIAEGRDLFTLPDLRSGPAAQIPGGTLRLTL
jgi:hypothetical protein